MARGAGGRGFSAFLFLPGGKGLIYGKMSVVSSYCCETNLPQNWWLKTTTIILLIVLFRTLRQLKKYYITEN